MYYAIIDGFVVTRNADIKVCKERIQEFFDSCTGYCGQIVKGRQLYAVNCDGAGWSRMTGPAPADTLLAIERY